MEFANTVLPGVQGINYTSGNLGDYTYFANKGFNLARVAFLWERAQPAVGGALDAGYMGDMDDVIDQAITAGIKVLWDCHNYAARDVSGTFRRVGSAQLTIADVADMWTKVVQHYLDDPTRLAAIWGWDIMNEPNNMPVPTSTSNYNTVATATLMNQACIDAIRAIDMTRYIVAEADQFSGLQAFYTYYGSGATPWLTDPAGKLYYSWHYYFDFDHSGSYSGASSWLEGSGLTMDQAGTYLTRVANWAIANNVLIDGNPAVFIGEYGIPNRDGQYMTCLNDFLNVADMYKIATTHWAAGIWYTSPTTLGPTNSYTVDRAQMEVVGKHLGTLN